MATLVVMAAGMGSRFGGLKQMTGFGPNGEILMEYTAADAARNGFDRCVFIIKPEMEQNLEQLIGGRLRSLMDVRYAHQDFSSLPDWFDLPCDRVRPYGTVHAALCAEEYVDDAFIILNADDFYGEDAFSAMSRQLPLLGENEAAMAGYKLGNTLSRHGGVTRGVCRLEGGYLAGVEEHRGLMRDETGVIRDRDNPRRTFPDDATVSMNFWGFRKEIFSGMQAYFEEFLRVLPEGDLFGECLLPRMVNHMAQEHGLRVRAVPTDSGWFGVTYQEDSPYVKEELLRLTREGKCRGL